MATYSARPEALGACPELLWPKVCAWRADSQNFLSFRGLCRKWGAIPTRHSGESRNPDSSPTPHLDTGFRRYDGPTNWTSCAKSLPGEGTWVAGVARAERSRRGRSLTLREPQGERGPARGSNSVCRYLGSNEHFLDEGIETCAPRRAGRGRS